MKKSKKVKLFVAILFLLIALGLLCDTLYCGGLHFSV